MHVYRPLWLFLGIIAVVLLVRAFAVPSGFGVHEQGYMYGWFNKNNETFWREFPVKYQGKESCLECHADQVKLNSASPHKNIQCENCHGPALDHPSEPEKLALDRSRELCLRCHSPLPYAQSERSRIRGIDPLKHNPGEGCVGCHNPHSPKL